MRTKLAVVAGVVAFALAGCGGKSVAWRMNHGCAPHGGIQNFWQETRKDTGVLLHVLCRDGSQVAVGE